MYLFDHFRSMLGTKHMVRGSWKTNTACLCDKFISSGYTNNYPDNFVNPAPTQDYSSNANPTTCDMMA
jgi:hypothetical protein